MDSNIHAAVRPNTISNLFKTGSNEAISKIIDTGELNHSFLLTGHHGCGKTTTQRALASYIFTRSIEEAYDLDNSECYMEIDSARYFFFHQFQNHCHHTTEIIVVWIETYSNYTGIIELDKFAS